MWRPLVKCSLQVPGSVGYLGWFKDVFHICARLTVCGQIWQCLPKTVSCQVKHWQSECEGAKRARKVIMAKLTHRLILGKAKVGNDWLVELGMSIGSPRWVVWGTTVKVRKFTSQGTCACIFFFWLEAAGKFPLKHRPPLFHSTIDSQNGWGLKGLCGDLLVQPHYTKQGH